MIHIDYKQPKEKIEKDIEEFLVSKGYKRYNQTHKGCAYAYFKNHGNKYQTAVYIYDFSKYDMENTIGYQYEFLLMESETRVDISSFNMTLDKFESMTELMYNTLIDSGYVTHESC